MNMYRKIFLIIVLFFICINIYASGQPEKELSILIINIGDNDIEIKCTNFSIWVEESWGNYSYNIYCYNNGEKVFEGKSTLFVYAYWKDDKENTE